MNTRPVIIGFDASERTLTLQFAESILDRGFAIGAEYIGPVESPLFAPACSLFVLRGKINGAMAYVRGETEDGYEEYVARASASGIYGATLFERKEDAQNALNKMRHGTAVLMEIAQLSLHANPTNSTAIAVAPAAFGGSQTKL